MTNYYPGCWYSELTNFPKQYVYLPKYKRKLKNNKIEQMQKLIHRNNVNNTALFVELVDDVKSLVHVSLQQANNTT